MHTLSLWQSHDRLGHTSDRDADRCGDLKPNAFRRHRQDEGQQRKLVEGDDVLTVGQIAGGVDDATGRIQEDQDGKDQLF